MCSKGCALSFRIKNKSKLTLVSHTNLFFIHYTFKALNFPSPYSLLFVYLAVTLSGVDRCNSLQTDLVNPIKSVFYFKKNVGPLTNRFFCLFIF